MKRLVVLVALAGLALAAAAPAAGAQKMLSISKASRVTEKVAERDCRSDPDCESSDSANCRRLAPRRVSCVASKLGTDEEGDYQCDRLVIVRLKDNGKTKHAAGKPSCFQV